jgi:hypothetical protein
MRFLLSLALVFPAPLVLAAELGLSSEACTYLRNRSAAYEADIDVRGNQLVPAELPGAPFSQVVYIPLTVDLAKRLGLELPLVESEALVGVVEYGVGGLHLNGVPVQTSELVGLCP